MHFECILQPFAEPPLALVSQPGGGLSPDGEPRIRVATITELRVPLRRSERVGLQIRDSEFRWFVPAYRGGAVDLPLGGCPGLSGSGGGAKVGYSR